MSVIQNMCVFHFGGGLNMMFDVIAGMSKIKLEKKKLFVNQRLTIKSSDTLDVMKIEDFDFNKVNLLDYSIVVIDSNVNDEMLKELAKDVYEDLAFIICTKDKINIDEEVFTFIDFEELNSLPMFKKIMRVNDIRKKLKSNKVLKKFKFF